MRARALVFVDAAIPECNGDARLNPVVVDLLRPLAVDGVLPPGFLRLGEGGLERLIPDSEMRARIEPRVEAELPELPMTLFEEGLPVAVGWCEWRCDYLLLSEEMRGAPSEAARLDGLSSKTWGIAWTSSTGLPRLLPI